jgi:hypothetical protein
MLVRRLPGQLDLELGSVIRNLELHFEMHLIRDVRDKTHVLALDHNIVVGPELVSDRVQGARPPPPETAWSSPSAPSIALEAPSR